MQEVAASGRARRVVDGNKKVASRAIPITAVLELTAEVGNNAAVIRC